jgi:transposase
MAKDNTPQVKFEAVIDRACGLDIHKDLIVATVEGSDIKRQTREFGATTQDLKSLKEWLESLQVSHVAMESTGIYWKPVLNILESDKMKILVVNARHIKYVPGHKTDKKDSAWICQLLRAGLLKNSFIPDRELRELRDLTRYREKLVRAQTAAHNRMIRYFEDANLKLSSVFSDIRGTTCTKVIDDILNGEFDPEKLSQHHHKRMKASKEDLKKAVEGKFTAHHKFMITETRKELANIEAQILDIEQEIARRMEPHKDAVERICEIPGIKETSAHAILAEIGFDMSVFPTDKNITSWAGLAPGNNESAGKKKSTHINHGNNMLRTKLVECAWSGSKVKDSYFKERYSRMVIRRGKKRSLIAIAAQMLRIIYHMLQEGTHYIELGPSYRDERQKENEIKKLHKRLNELEGTESTLTKNV